MIVLQVCYSLYFLLVFKNYIPIATSRELAKLGSYCNTSKKNLSQMWTKFARIFTLNWQFYPEWSMVKTFLSPELYSHFTRGDNPLHKHEAEYNKGQISSSISQPMIMILSIFVMTYRSSFYNAVKKIFLVLNMTDYTFTEWYECTNLHFLRKEILWCTALRPLHTTHETVKIYFKKSV